MLLITRSIVLFAGLIGSAAAFGDPPDPAAVFELGTRIGALQASVEQVDSSIKGGDTKAAEDWRKYKEDLAVRIAAVKKKVLGAEMTTAQGAAELSNLEKSLTGWQAFANVLRERTGRKDDAPLRLRYANEIEYEIWQQFRPLVLQSIEGAKKFQESILEEHRRTGQPLGPIIQRRMMEDIERSKKAQQPPK